MIPSWYCRPLDSAWKPILGDQALSSPTSLTDLEPGKSKQCYLPIMTSMVSLPHPGLEGYSKACRVVCAMDWQQIHTLKLQGRASM